MANKYPHKLTYWKPQTLDRYGNPTWSIPSTIDCRWEDTIKRFVNSDGDLDVSRAMILVPEKLVPGVYVFRGASNESTPPNDAWEIKQYNEVSNVLNTKVDRTVII